MTGIVEFPVIARAAEILDQIDSHRLRRRHRLLAERYGWNLQPAEKKITPVVCKHNRRELPVI